MPPLNRLYLRRSTTHRKENRYASVHIKVIYDRVSPVIKQREPRRIEALDMHMYLVYICVRVRFIFTIYLSEAGTINTPKKLDITCRRYLTEFADDGFAFRLLQRTFRDAASMTCNRTVVSAPLMQQAPHLIKNQSIFRPPVRYIPDTPRYESRLARMAEGTSRGKMTMICLSHVDSIVDELP